MDALFGGKSDAKLSDSDSKSSGSESEDAAQDILDAIADQDARALDLALKRHYELCEGSMDTEEEESEEV